MDFRVWRYLQQRFAPTTGIRLDTQEAGQAGDGPVYLFDLLLGNKKRLAQCLRNGKMIGVEMRYFYAGGRFFFNPNRTTRLELWKEAEAEVLALLVDTKLGLSLDKRHLGGWIIRPKQQGMTDQGQCGLLLMEIIIRFRIAVADTVLSVNTTANGFVQRRQVVQTFLMQALQGNRTTFCPFPLGAEFLLTRNNGEHAVVYIEEPDQTGFTLRCLLAFRLVRDLGFEVNELLKDPFPVRLLLQQDRT